VTSESPIIAGPYWTNIRIPLTNAKTFVYILFYANNLFQILLSLTSVSQSDPYCKDKHATIQCHLLSVSV